MDTPGSNVASDSAGTSLADSISTDSPSGHNSKASGDLHTTSLIENDDSASDVSMSAETEDEDDEDLNASTIQVNTPPATTYLPASKKRKGSGSTEDIPNGGIGKGAFPEVRKRHKPGEDVQTQGTPEGHGRKDRSLLPAEIWHHIFTFCPPRVLGLLLQVNKSFNAYLDPFLSDHSIAPISRSVAQVLKPDAIWRASRRLFRPGIPAPLSGKSELDMWKLACCMSCQFCGKKRQLNPVLPIDQWHAGPGENGVVPVWSFGIRTCGPCLRKRTTKVGKNVTNHVAPDSTNSRQEIDLLLSSSVPSPLMAALPFVFLTNEFHVLSSATLQNGQPPPSIQITKYFFKAHVENIKQEFFEVKTMGSAAAEEWLKGLDDRGKESRSDGVRWERWEVSGGVSRMHNLEPHERRNYAIQTRGLPPNPNASNPTKFPPTMKNNIPVFHGYSSNQQAPQPPSQVSHLPQQISSPFPTNHAPPRFDSETQNGVGFYQSRSYLPTRHERTKEEVAELKAARRDEIERRCMLLKPPLTAGVLAQMGSFQAAIQIIQPLDDGAWEVLKPRLLSQREEAQQRENDRLAQTRVVQERSDERRYQDLPVKVESKDAVDKEWDDIQAPLRSRIGGYADEIVRDGWNGGDKISKENCPRFAAEVLIYVRKRFYAEIAKDEAAIRATGHEPDADPPNGPFTRKLILENMKWVFDTKIKPHTEQYRKELFLCNACENNFKFYGFEGVIQHYAAKHTSSLSVGSVVVHWKSEWPEYPPFNPDPTASKNSYYTAAPSASVPYTSTGPSLQPNYSYGGYQPAQVPTPMQPPNPHGYQESPSPYYGHPQFGDQYSGHQNGPYMPPQSFPEASQGYQVQQYSAGPPGGNIPGYIESSLEYSQPGFGGSYPAFTQSMYASPHPGPIYTSSVLDNSGQQPVYESEGGQYDHSYSQPPSHPTGPFAHAPQRTEAYKAQLQDVARNTRDIWNSINTLKEIPGSVKVHTLIYHVLKRFRANFQDDPPLSMIIDGLSNNKDMRPARNIHGLLCKACSLGMAGSSASNTEKKHSFRQLINHFHLIHEQRVSQNSLGHVPDWTTDMVDLPDSSKLASLANAPGMDDQKLKLFMEALPELFSTPLPVVDSLHHASSYQAYGETGEQDARAQLAPSRDDHEKYYTTVDNSKPSDPGYDSGQYDPRNPRNPWERELPEDASPKYLLSRRNQGRRQEMYLDRADRSRAERRAVSPPSQVRPSDEFDRSVIREEAPLYLDKPVRYRNPDTAEYRVRRDPPMLIYDDPDPAPPVPEYRSDYGRRNSQSLHSNRQDLPPVGQDIPSKEGRFRPVEVVPAQKSRSIYEVVAQISQQAQQAREKQSINGEPVEAGSEDGELRVERSPIPESTLLRQNNEVSTPAERSINDFPGETAQAAAKLAEEAERRKEDELRARWDAERIENMQRVYQQSAEPQRRTREEYEQDDRVMTGAGRQINSVGREVAHNGYIVHERAPQPRQARTYTYDDRYVGTIPEQTVPRDRSPELVDRRFKLNTVVYRDERQNSHGAHRTPSRFARYESVRLENDRARSRSPVYVKMGPQPTQYRERSPGFHPMHQEPIYRTRTPQAPAEEATYERAPRQEYYRVYTDDPRSRQPQYTEAFEYVQVSDPQGDYMIRRPVRREPEQIYGQYEDEIYTRQPVYETQATVSRSDPAYYEEYDPRHPAPPPAAPVRQVRYH